MQASQFNSIDSHQGNKIEDLLRREQLDQKIFDWLANPKNRRVMFDYTLQSQEIMGLPPNRKKILFTEQGPMHLHVLRRLDTIFDKKIKPTLERILLSRKSELPNWLRTSSVLFNKSNGTHSKPITLNPIQKLKLLLIGPIVFSESEKTAQHIEIRNSESGDLRARCAERYDYQKKPEVLSQYLICTDLKIAETVSTTCESNAHCTWMGGADHVPGITNYLKVYCNELDHQQTRQAGSPPKNVQ